MEIIEQEKINEKFGIVLQYGVREIGYEICISDEELHDDWYETDGNYLTKKDAMKRYNEMKQEYKIKAKSIEYKYLYEDDETGNALYDFCTACNKPVKQKDLGNGSYGCEYCKSANSIEIREVKK